MTQGRHKLPDQTGVRYGALTVIEEAGKKGKHRRWRCLCDCGNETVVRQTALRSKHTVSCGCIRRQWMSKWVMHDPGRPKQTQGQ